MEYTKKPTQQSSREFEPWERKSLAPYFVILTILLVGTTVWAMWDESYSRRPWKNFQKRFFMLAETKYKKDLRVAQENLKSAEYKDLYKEFLKAKQNYENAPNVKKIYSEIFRLDKELLQIRTQFQMIRGNYQATVYTMERTTNKATKKRLYKQIITMEPRVIKLLSTMELLQTKKKNLQNKLTVLAKKKIEAENKLVPFEIRVQEAKGFLDALKNEKLKTRQVFNNDLNIVDRCQSCHISADKKGFDNNFKHPFKSHPPVFFIPKTPSLIQNIFSIHPPEQFGCSICHRGQGIAVNTVPDAHGEVELVLTPLLRGKFAQATCLKCHTQETELDGVPVLNEGRKLVVEYGCIGCHTFAQITAEETNRQIAPDLSEIRKKLLSPVWLVNWIEKPKKLRPATKMPNFSLKREQALQIAAYLWQNADKPTKEILSPPLLSPEIIEQGRTLFENIGCLACHKTGKNGVSNFAPNLEGTGEKIRYEYLTSWLINPKNHQPNGRMPNLRLTREEASLVATYLYTQKMETQNPTSMSQPNPKKSEMLQKHKGTKAQSLSIVDGVSSINSKSSTINHYQTGMSDLPSTINHKSSIENIINDPAAARQGKNLIKHYGCFGCHKIKGMENRGKIGAELSQFGSKPVTQLDYGLLEEKVLHSVGLEHIHENVAQARIAWVMQKLKNPRSYDKGRYRKFEDKLRMPNFNFNRKQIESITTFLMGLTDEKIMPNWQKRLNEREASVAKGLRLINKYNCVGCHQFKLETVTFTRDNTMHRIECVTKIKEQGISFFHLWKALPALERVANDIIDVSETEILNCTYGLGGDVVPIIIDKWVQKENLVPEEARPYAPPILVGEGYKVQPSWLFDFLKKPVVLRPWLQVRMPTFALSDEDAAAISSYFAAVDNSPFPYRTVMQRENIYITAKQHSAPDYYARARRLMDFEEVKCGSCHVRGAQKPEGNPSDWAPDLSLAPQRLHPEWILSWLTNPQSFYPGTKMPKIPFGKFQEIFPGTAEDQMNALVDLLMSGKLAEQEPGKAKTVVSSK